LSQKERKKEKKKKKGKKRKEKETGQYDNAHNKSLREKRTNE